VEPGEEIQKVLSLCIDHTISGSYFPWPNSVNGSEEKDELKKVV